MPFVSQSASSLSLSSFISEVKRLARERRLLKTPGVGLDHLQVEREEMLLGDALYKQLTREEQDTLMGIIGDLSELRAIEEEELGEEVREIQTQPRATA